MINELDFNVKKFNETLSAILGKVDAIQDKLGNGMKEDKWLSSGEAAAEMNLSVRTIMNYKASGIVPFSKVGGRLYFRRSDLIKVLENGKS
ncbi:MAG: helix-turn-helix domain-containing protein [Tenuifilaceae bacterium]|nr:helix-turn-helix domain-containing protein [Tenuifilaceae bacterium]